MPLGGLARRATYYQTLKDQKWPLLIVDSGGFTARFRTIDTLKTKTLVHGLSLLGYDVLNLGDDDLCLGRSALLNIQNQFGVQFISSNVLDANTGKFIVSPFRIQRIGGTKLLGLNFGGTIVGVLGVTTGDCLPECPGSDSQSFKLDDPTSAAQKIVKQLKSKCDVIVVLAHLGSEQCAKLASDVPDIDVIICSHATLPRSEPKSVDRVKIYQAGAKGWYVGAIHIFGKTSSDLQQRFELIAMNNSIRENAIIDSLIAAFKSETRKLSQAHISF